jgi:predicted CoA-substrate-specific enzyme activase
VKPGDNESLPGKTATNGREAMAVVAGIDVGSGSTRAIIWDAESERGLGSSFCTTGHDLEAAAKKAYTQALDSGGLNDGDIAYRASTGFGRYQVSFRDLAITEITCHAVGAVHAFPGTRSVLDVGAQNCRAMKIKETGQVVRFKLNDKCAAGGGRFLERVAKGLELELEHIGPLSLDATDPKPISSVCAVLAESEIINQVTAGCRVEDILDGVHDSLSERIAAQMRQVGLQEEVTLTGGVARNAGMVRALERRLDVSLNVGPEAEYAGALGAAILSSWRLDKKLRGRIA